MININKIAGITPYCETVLISPYITRGQTTEGFDASKREPLPVKDQGKMGDKASTSQVGGKHYKEMEIQPAEFCQKNKLHFCESAAIKYICRHRLKNGSEDIKKAIHFLQLLLEWDYKQTTPVSISEFDLYQKAAEEFAIYPTLGHPIVYPALGLAGEAGEVAEKVKKMGRDDNCILTDDRKEAIKKELGDVLWYASEVSRQAGFKLSDIAKSNIEKLNSRVENGTLSGDGDNR